MGNLESQSIKATPFVKLVKIITITKFKQVLILRLHLKITAKLQGIRQVG